MEPDGALQKLLQNEQRYVSTISVTDHSGNPAKGHGQVK
jgi:hypothetical protein